MRTHTTNGSRPRVSFELIYRGGSPDPEHFSERREALQRHRELASQRVPHTLWEVTDYGD